MKGLKIKPLYSDGIDSNFMVMFEAHVFNPFILNRAQTSKALNKIVGKFLYLLNFREFLAFNQ